MRKVKEMLVFIDHFDWWDYSEDGKFFVPTEKAPPEAIKAIEIVNDRIKRNEFA